MRKDGRIVSKMVWICEKTNRSPFRRAYQMEDSPIIKGGGRARPRKTVGEIIKNDLELCRHFDKLVFD